MAQKTMYPGQVNSPITELSSAINNTVTTITVLDGNQLPAAPNIAVIGNGEVAETILYTGKSGNNLTGVTRGFQGAARSWSAGIQVARFFTAYDYDTLRENVEQIGTVVQDSNTVVIGDYKLQSNNGVLDIFYIGG